MTKTLGWILGGIGVGLIIHLVVILSLPSLSQKDNWTQIEPLSKVEDFYVFKDVGANAPNPFKLDPELLYGACRLDLLRGVGVLSAQLPDAFWSLSLFDESGRAIFGTVNRPGVDHRLEVGIFNATQIRQLAEQKMEPPPNQLIVESDSDTVFAIVRLAPPHPAMRVHYRERLSQVRCSHISS